MIDGIAPQCVVVGEPVTQKLHHAIVEIAPAATLGLVPQAEGDEVEIHPVQVMVTQILEHILLGAVLRDPRP